MKHHLLLTITFCCVVAAAAAAAAAATASPPEALPTLTLDPVELIRGHEVPGDEALSLDHGGFRYRFANAANRATFATEPERYEIQLGGACARMGALSGRGRTDLFTVHDGHIYIFASESCRNAFRQDPAAVLDTEDPRPYVFNRDAVVRGAALVERAVEGMGGADAVDTVAVYQERADREVEYEGKAILRTRGFTIDFPNGIRRDRTWADERWTEAVAGDLGWFESSEGTRGMCAQQRRVLERLAARNVLVILRSRGRDDFLAIAGGSGVVDGAPVDFVDVHFDGCHSMLGIDRATGRILSQTYRGRGPSMRLGVVQRRFSDFQAVEGLTLPRTIATTFDGEPIEDSPVRLAQLRVARAD